MVIGTILLLRFVHRLVFQNGTKCNTAFGKLTLSEVRR